MAESLEPEADPFDLDAPPIPAYFSYPPPRVRARLLALGPAGNTSLESRTVVPTRPMRHCPIFATLLASMCLPVLACGGTTIAFDGVDGAMPVEVGPLATGTGGSSGTGSTGSAGSQGTGGTANVADASPDAVDGSGGASLDGLQGSWKGYVENFQFSDQSDAVLVEFGSGAGPANHVRFGNASPPPPVTSPNLGYPPGVAFSGGPGRPALMGPYPGFAFTLTNVTYDRQRLQFDVATNELWKEWCGLQIPILDEINPDGSYYCVHNWGFTAGGTACSQVDPMTQMSVPIDCGKLALCQPAGGVCVCNAQGCVANLNADLHFDMMIAPPKVDGSVRGLDSGSHNVHLNKQQ